MTETQKEATGKNTQSIAYFKNEFKREIRNGVIKTSVGVLSFAASIKGLAIANEMGQNFDKAQDAIKDKIYNVILSGLVRKDPSMTAAANQITGNAVGTQTIWDPVNNATIVAKNTLDHLMATLQSFSKEDGFPTTMTDFSQNPAYQYLWSKTQTLLSQYAHMDNTGIAQVAFASVAGVGIGITMFVWAKTSHNFGNAMEALRKGRELLSDRLGI